MWRLEQDAGNERCTTGQAMLSSVHPALFLGGSVGIVFELVPYGTDDPIDAADNLEEDHTAQANQRVSTWEPAPPTFAEVTGRRLACDPGCDRPLSNRG